MPPEQAAGRATEIDARSDVWAAGATLFTLLSGKILHEAPTPNEALVLAMTAPLTRSALRALDAPPAVHAVLERALAFDRTSRFADAGAMRDAVLAAQVAEPPKARLRSKRLVPWSIGSAAIAAVAVLAWKEWRAPPPITTSAPAIAASEIASEVPAAATAQAPAPDPDVAAKDASPSPDPSSPPLDARAAPSRTAATIAGRPVPAVSSSAGSPRIAGGNPTVRASSSPTAPFTAPAPSHSATPLDPLGPRH
jgi:serine/threonine-protein kinase